MLVTPIRSNSVARHLPDVRGDRNLIASDGTGSIQQQLEVFNDRRRKHEIATTICVL